MFHACVRLIAVLQKDLWYCEATDCDFDGTLADAVRHVVQHQFVVR